MLGFNETNKYPKDQLLMMALFSSMMIMVTKPIWKDLLEANSMVILINNWQGKCKEKKTKEKST